MFDQFKASIKLSKDLSILVEEIQKYGIEVKESKIEDNFTSYYSHYYKVIGVDLASESCMIASLLHEFGHHLQTLDSNYSKSWCKYYQEEDAWNRGEAFYQQILGKSIFEAYHKQKASSLCTYEYYQNYSIAYFHWEYSNIGEEPSLVEGILPVCCDIHLVKKVKKSKWFTLLIAGITVCSLIGGVVTYNSLTSTNQFQIECNDYDCF